MHEQLKTVVLEAWDRITPQEEPTGSYTKILQGPNENYADFLARLETVISHAVIGEETKKQLEKLPMRMQIGNVKKLSLQFVRLKLLLII